MQGKSLVSSFLIFVAIVFSARAEKTESQIQTDYLAGCSLVKSSGTKYFVRPNDTDGLRIAYTVIPADSKKMIVIVPGYTESPYKYCELIHDLHAKNYQVAFMSLRGMGLSERYPLVKGMDIPTMRQTVHVDKFDDYVQDLRFFLTKLNQAFKDSDLFVFSHSTGGLVTAYVLPDAEAFRIKAAVLNSPLMGLPTAWYEQIVLTLDRTLFQPRYAPIPLQKFYDAKKGTFADQTDTNHEFRWKLYNRILELNPNVVQSMPSRNWIREIERATTTAKLQAIGAKVKVPVLIFSAGHDTFVDTTTHYTYGAANHKAGGHNVTIELFPGSYHSVWRGTHYEKALEATLLQFAQ